VTGWMMRVMGTGIVALSMLGGCQRLECGYGTREVDGACMAGYDEVLCGPGTELVDGECLATIDGLDCGPGTVPRGDECVEADLQFVSIPFPDGTPVTISQGHFGYYSHTGSSQYAVDFTCDEGSSIVAARRGIVRAIREDSDTGCADVSCADDANYVIVDHGDGTMASYWHLQHDGALVEPGDPVDRGQPVARSGNTGWSTGPHLHFSADDLYGSTLPLYIEEYGDLTHGVPNAGQQVTSANVQQQSGSGEVAFSSCPWDTFLHMGVELGADLPCSVADRGGDYELSGWAGSDGGQLMVARYIGVQQGWDYDCVALDSDGTFDTTLSWPATTFGSQTYLMLAAATSDCTSYQGWDGSVWISLW
jgi:hypothetical protein